MRKKIFTSTLNLLVFMLITTSVYTMPISKFSVSNGWTQFGSDDGVGSGGFVDPGYGSQPFDAEYLFYKQEGNLLSIALQTGFDVIHGSYIRPIDGKTYYSGDLALSFNNYSSPFNGNYEYAVDFGFLTKDYNGNSVGPGGTHIAGLYSVDPLTGWNNNMVDAYEVESKPFAMQAGINVPDALVSNVAGLPDSTYINNKYVYEHGEKSHYRIVTLDLKKINGIGAYKLNAHWTMNCGNDYVRGSFNGVKTPEPGTFMLLGSCVFGIFAVYKKRKIR